LFAGIGGFDLAMERAGVNVTFACEIDPACRGVLARHFPEAQVLPDVTEVGSHHIYNSGFCPGQGILTAGWPCQGNSVAGRRAGMADPRSGLWREVARIAGDLRPRWLVGENVPGILTVRGGADFLEVVRSLDELGYGVAWRVLDAQHLGVPQRRRRVILVGCLGDPARAAEVLFEPESMLGSAAPRPEARARVAGTLAASAGSGCLGGIGQSASTITSRITETVSTLQGGGRRGYRVDAEGAAGGHLIPVAVDNYNFLAGEPDGPAFSHLSANGGYTNRMVAVFHQNQRGELRETAVTGSIATAGGKPGQGYPAVRIGLRVRRFTPLECERLQGFPDGWTEGQPDAARYRQTGNAVAVPVIEWLMRRIAGAS